MKLNFFRRLSKNFQPYSFFSTMKDKSHTVGAPYLDPITVSTS